MTHITDTASHQSALPGTTLQGTTKQYITTNTSLSDLTHKLDVWTGKYYGTAQSSLRINADINQELFGLNLQRQFNRERLLELGSILNPLAGKFSEDTQKKGVGTKTGASHPRFYLSQYDWLKGSHMTKVVWLPNETDYSYCEFVAPNTPYWDAKLQMAQTSSDNMKLGRHKGSGIPFWVEVDGSTVARQDEVLDKRKVYFSELCNRPEALTCNFDVNRYDECMHTKAQMETDKLSSENPLLSEWVSVIKV